MPTEFDPNDGSSAGAAFVPSDIDPVNQTRSDARRTYFDPYVSRPNFHVITGQHVTRVLIEGVGSNYAVSNPTSGGNENGNGMNGMASNEGFGFGPGGSTPALDNSTTAQLSRRQSPSTSNLRITGVEVSLCTIPDVSPLTSPVRCQCLGRPTDHHCHPRSYRCSWFTAFCTTPTIIRRRPFVSSEHVWYPCSS